MSQDDQEALKQFLFDMLVDHIEYKTPAGFSVGKWMSFRVKRGQNDNLVMYHVTN